MNTIKHTTSLTSFLVLNNFFCKLKKNKYIYIYSFVGTRPLPYRKMQRHLQTTEPFKQLNQKVLQEQFLCIFGNW